MKDVCWVSESVDAAAPLSLAAYDLVPPVEIIVLPQQGVNNQNVGIRTGAGDFVVKTYTSYDDPASIHYEHRLLSWLAGAGLSFAVPVPILTCDGASLCDGPHGRTSLSLRLSGSRLDPNRQDHVELLGAAAGELQVALRHYPTAPRPGRPLFSTLFGFPLPSRDPFTLTPNHLGLPDSPPYDDLLRWWRAEAAQLKAFVEGRYRTLPWQVCHNDVTPANVLVDAGRVTAVLDFEFAAPTARALDVAMGLRMTMRVWEDSEPWEAARLFCRGYTRWMPLTEAEVTALPWLIRLRGAITVLWWMGRTAIAGEASPIPTRIGYMRNFVRWLDRHEQRFVDAVMREVL